MLAPFRHRRAWWALGYLWSTLWLPSVFADQPNTDGHCRNDAGLLMPCEEVAGYPVREAPAARRTPAPAATPEPSTDFAIDGGAGLAGTLTSEGNKAEPILELLAGFDVSTAEKSPRLDFAGRFGTLEGSTATLSDPASFRSVSFEGRLSQPLADGLLLRPAVLVGIEIRMATGGVEPRHQGARYAYLGAQFAGDDGYVFIGAGGDERVSTSVSASPAYLPAVTASWLLKLTEFDGKKFRAYLTGRVIAYARLGYGAADAGNASATVGFMIGGGNKR